uniref:Uncharacterized protein n=1 Tax=Anguilla anguilla TaxID=7936 RepID=A0A0E9TAG4_ANGAN
MWPALSLAKACVQGVSSWQACMKKILPDKPVWSRVDLFG